jgi:hypothetical protein
MLLHRESWETYVVLEGVKTLREVRSKLDMGLKNPGRRRGSRGEAAG